MRVVVRGESPVMGTLEWKKTVTWYGEHLLGAAADKLTVFLELAPYLRGVAGSISCTDWRKRRSFLIQLQTGIYGIRKQLYTLGHEMTHLRQIVDGDLTVHHGTIVWRSERHVPGLDEPWEVEAYAAERPLYSLFMKT